MGEAAAAAATTTAGTRHTAHDTRGTRGNGIRRPYTDLGRKDTCCTALWVAVSGLCDSLSSVRICLSPSSCGCHAIFIVFFNSTTVTRSLPSLTSQINGSSPQRSHSLPLSFARLPSTAAARPIPALSLIHPCERAPSRPWSREGAPRPSSASAARSPRETPAFPFRRRPSRHFSRAPLFRSFGKIRPGTGSRNWKLDGHERSPKGGFPAGASRNAPRVEIPIDADCESARGGVF